VHLDYLYTLTVADINGTNPNLWNTWRASLLRKLYLSTKRALTQGLEITVDKDSRIRDTQDEVTGLLKEKGYGRKDLIELWHGVHEDYFLREAPEDLAWQTEEFARHGDSGAPLIGIRNTTTHTYEGATQVMVKAPNSAFLFANLSTAFDRLNLNIQDARMYHMDDNQCVTTFMVLEADGTPLTLSKPRLDEMQNMLRKYAEAKQALPGNKGNAPTRKQRHFNRHTVTMLTNNDTKPYSILEVLCPDRPGLLAVIAHIFVDMGITLHNAKITTLGENVEDVFFITDMQDRKLLEPALGTSLQGRIKERLDAETSTGQAA
jgi:[protein-PII] uridylyltransferase